LKNILLISFLFLLGCDSPHYGVIHWKTEFNPSKTEIKYADSLNHAVWMVRYFDLIWDENKGVQPAAILQKNNRKIQIHSAAIYIQRKVLEQVNTSQLPVLANKIKLLTQLLEKGTDKSPELLIDFDWNRSTKQKYFKLLELIQRSIPDKIISSTIRLDQYAHPKQLGVPPVSKGLLMLYQTGSFQKSDQPILFQQKIAEKYVSKGDYPIPLDVAIATFSWGILERYWPGENGKTTKIIYPITEEELNQHQQLKSTKKLTWKANKPFFFHGFYILPKDIIRLEKLSSNDLTWSIVMAKNITGSNNHIYLYHLSEAANGQYPIKLFP
jgi:hypothetical protein